MSTLNKNSKRFTYKNAGVNINEGNKLVNKIKNIVKQTERPGSIGNIGGFGGLFDLKKAGYKDPILVSATDGVGTKILLADEMNMHDSIGIDLVAMSVNDIVVQGAEPLFFLDYLASGKLNSDKSKQIISGIAKGAKLSGCSLIGGETAELPGIYEKNIYDLAGFAVGAAERNKLLPKKNLSNKDIILSLTSSGIHSNGFSLIRQIIKQKNIRLNDKVLKFSKKSLGEYLLKPTKIYVKSILYQNSLNNLKACAHITGGGIIENIPRAIPDSLSANIFCDLLKPPQIFSWIKSEGNISNLEMLKTFNCGVGMCIIVSPKKVDEVRDYFNKIGENASIVGELSTNSNNKKINLLNKKNIW